jgi:type III secretory pathway component EscR
LRANLQNVPATSAAYKRYLDKFDKQETQIELLQEEVRKLQMEEKSQQAEVDDVLSGISAE